ncbi:MAG: hypothetical protein ACM35G_06030 [Planctomycetaceae bacterium]
MLSATASGTDFDGDTWTLRLIGPGSLAVTKQDNGEINQITVAGAEPLVTRLIGHVTKGPNGDGKVFFQSLNELPSRTERLGAGQSLLSIVMPNFWLGTTTPVNSSTTPLPPAPSITIPDGVNTLDFGGVDTRHDITSLPSTTTQNAVNPATVTLGLPVYGGTSIIIDQSISSTQPVTTTPPGSTTPTTTTIQFPVEFNVSGRLSLFQANSIVGDANNPPSQFISNPPAGSTPAIGGTIVVSGTSGTPPFLVNGQLQGGLTGQIGNLRIGGPATNLTALAFDTTNSGTARISNFSIGGETNNVLVIAPNGLRNAAFGLGMDKTEILAHVINTLAANRGALNSNVTVDRTISRATFGGDVVNSRILSGYAQNFSNAAGGIIGTIAGGSVPPPPQNAQTGGGMEVHVAGDVTNSVFAASVQPLIDTTATPPTLTFGTPQDVPGVVVLPTGHIAAKVEGKINNGAIATSPTDNNATVDRSGKAFYAKAVDLKSGPVVPPNVPEPPYPGPKQPIHAPGLRSRFRLFPFTAKNSSAAFPDSPHTAGHDTPVTPLPRGPLAHATARRTQATATAKTT